MVQPAGQLDRFVRNVHLRMRFWRTVEGAGLGVAGACGVALVLLPLLVSRGSEPLEALGVILLLGAIIGGLWGTVRRPALLAAAMEIDRQFHLHDLVSTSLSLRRLGQSENPWAATVLALAEQRCGGLAISQLMLRRLGLRSWSAIALAMVLILSLGALLSGPAESRADSSASRFLTAAQVRQLHEQEISAFSPPPARPHGDRSEAWVEAKEDPTARASKDPTGRMTGANGDNGATGGQTPGSGAGEAHTPSASIDPRPVPYEATRADRNDPEGSISGGTGRSSPTRTASAGLSGTAAGVAPGRRSAPAWTRETWPADRAAAQQAIGRGSVPDAYRDVVREYFDSAERPSSAGK